MEDRKDNSYISASYILLYSLNQVYRLRLEIVNTILAQIEKHNLT